jgi:TonB family protein
MAMERIGVLAIGLLGCSPALQPKAPVMHHYDAPRIAEGLACVVSRSEASREAQVSGAVSLQLQLDEGGRPGKATILENPGFGLAEASLYAARACRFEPPRFDGSPLDDAVVAVFAFTPAKEVASISLSPRAELEGLQMPRLAGRCSAFYPPESRDVRSGKVVLDVLIDTDGIPKDVRIVSSSGAPFTRVVLQVFPFCRFYPARISGEPVCMSIPYTFRFLAE